LNFRLISCRFIPGFSLGNFYFCRTPDKRQQFLRQQSYPFRISINVFSDGNWCGQNAPSGIHVIGTCHGNFIGYRVAGFLDPCLSGSGDFFDVFSVGEGKTGFYGLDIMGHGIIASLMAFTLHDLLPALGWGSAGVELSPTGVLRALNERYSGKSAIRSTFFTIAYGVIDNATGEYRAVRGGHTPVLHLEAGGRMRIHYTKGAAVGVMADAEAEEARGTLSPGDRLIIASDGMIEAFGGEGLLDKALERLSAFADGIREAKIEEFVDAFRRRSREESAKRLSRDDVSLLVIERI